MSILATAAAAAGLISLGLLLGVTGCASPRITAYREHTPKLDIREYFNGTVKAYGTAQDFTGKVVSRFTADIVGKWEGSDFTLSENFVFDDGSTEERVWDITFDPETETFAGTAHDIIGKMKGQQLGNAVFMKYVIRREINGSTIDLSMDDRMYRVDEKHVMNQAKMRKFGITVGELNIAFYKQD